MNVKLVVLLVVLAITASLLSACVGGGGDGDECYSTSQGTLCVGPSGSLVSEDSAVPTINVDKVLDSFYESNAQENGCSPEQGPFCK